MRSLHFAGLQYYQHAAHPWSALALIVVCL